MPEPSELAAANGANLRGGALRADGRAVIATNVLSREGFQYPRIARPRSNSAQAPVYVDHTTFTRHVRTGDRFENWHRVFYKSVWVVASLGRWRFDETTQRHERQVVWVRHGVAATRTYLVRNRGWLGGIKAIDQREGPLYVSREPMEAAQVLSQTVSNPWEFTHPLPRPHVNPNQAIFDAAASAVAMDVAATTDSMLQTLRTRPSAGRGSALRDMPTNAGTQFALEALAKSMVADNELMASVFDGSAMWTGRVDAPYPRYPGVDVGPPRAQRRVVPLPGMAPCDCQPRSRACFEREESNARRRSPGEGGGSQRERRAWRAAYNRSSR